MIIFMGYYCSYKLGMSYKTLRMVSIYCIFTFAVLAVGAYGKPPPAAGLYQHGTHHTLNLNDITPGNRTLCQPGAEIPPNRVNTTTQVSSVRSVMSWGNVTVDAYYIPYEDQHIADPADHDRKVQFVSGFSGSDGYAVVVAGQAGNVQAVWADGRYFLQADQQMDCNWILMEIGTDGYPYAEQWLIDILPDNSLVGMDPKLVSIDTWETFEAAFEDEREKNIQLVGLDYDLVEYVWTEDRPPKPNEPIYIHTLEYAGREWTDKVQELREHLIQEDVDAIFVTALDETAWLFNLRGADRNTSPLFYSYALVTRSEIRLYLSNPESLLTPELMAHLNMNEDGSCEANETLCVAVMEYEGAVEDLMNYVGQEEVYYVWISPTSNYAVYQATEGKRFVEHSPLQLMKSMKNEVERTRYYQCQVRDSAAVVEFAAQIEEMINNGETVTELSASELLLEIRAQDEAFRMNSFTSISAVGPNAAVVHYRPSPETDTQITTEELYLLDSGGNYLDGTTDVTRTFHFGTPTTEEIEAYTIVLIAAIELAVSVWPEGIYGRDIDVRARNKLWQRGWDYNHGTGHGIGYFLNVHEGPGRINVGYDPSQSPLYEGMFFSDEPGYYKDGYFGIRLETIVGVEVMDTPDNYNGKDYLGFRPATLVPFEPRLVDYDMLTVEHRQWLNTYNARCRNETGSLLLSQGKTQAYDWLMTRTDQIPDTPVWAPVISGANTGGQYSSFQNGAMCALLLAACVILW